MCKAAPQEQARRQRLNVGQYACAGRGKAGYDLKQSVGEARRKARYPKRRETAAKPSFEYIDLSCGFTQQDTSPAASAKLADRANAVPTPSPEINASAVGMSINAPTASSTQPTKYLTML